MRRLTFSHAIMLLGLASGLPLSGTASEQPFTPDYHPVLNISRLQGEIEIDGDLSDSGWKTAARADGFVENSPGDQIKPGVESAALMTYDQSNLYVALIAYDNPAEVRASLSERDDIFRDDYFGLMLDTYGDRAWGYEIFVNPLGIQRSEERRVGKECRSRWSPYH